MIFQNNRLKLYTLALGFFLIVSRLFFLEETPYDWDSVNLIFAIDDFDLLQDKPHPPGYIGFILASRFVNVLVNDPHAALLSLNFICTILLTFGVFQLGKYLINQKVGIIAATISAFNPLVWFYGEVISLYLIGSAVWVWLTYVFAKIYNNPSGFRLVLCGLLWGLSGAFRPDVMVFLIPLAVYCLGRRSFLRKAGLLAVFFVLGNFLWLAPTLVWANLNFMTALFKLFTSTTTSSSVFMGATLQQHAVMLVKAAIWLFIGIGWILPVIFLKMREKHASCSDKNRRIEKFLFMAFLPALAFQLSFHLVKPGYILLFLPGLIVLGVLWMDEYYKWTANGVSPVRTNYIWVILILSAAYFLFYPAGLKPPGSEAISKNLICTASRKMDTLARSRIAVIDKYTMVWTDAIKSNYDRDAAVIWISGRDYDWRRVSYQLPDFRVMSLLPHPVNGNIARLGFNKSIEPIPLGSDLTLGCETILLFTEDVTLVDSLESPGVTVNRKQISHGITYYEVKFNLTIQSIVYEPGHKMRSSGHGSNKCQSQI
jgi:hypothetical protein